MPRPSLISSSRASSSVMARFFRVEGETKLTLACQLRKPAHEWGHWYAVVVGEKGQQIPEGYLGVVGGSGNPASDGADHYSVRGYLNHARA